MSPLEFLGIPLPAFWNNPLSEGSRQKKEVSWTPCLKGDQWNFAPITLVSLWPGPKVALFPPKKGGMAQNSTDSRRYRAICAPTEIVRELTNSISK